jgi:polysaccharide biosynthesis protein PslG
MNKKFTLFLSLLFVLSVSYKGISQTKTIYKQLIKPQAAKYFHTPIGLCEDYPEETTNREKIDNDMKVLKTTGVHLLRIAFGWDGIEGQKGKYNWLFWDYYVNTAKKYGITLIPYVCYTPMWNSTGDSTNYWNHTPKDYQAYGKFVTRLVNRYKYYIHSWELWNEPDIPDFWSGNAKDLAKLIKIGSKAVRKADPTAIVVCPGLAHHTNFTLQLFKDYGVSPYVDVVNCHDYDETWSGKPIEDITNYLNTLTNIIKKYGKHQSLWTAEVGYSDFRKGAYVSDSYTAYYNYEHTPEYQAEELFKTVSLILSTNDVAAIAWYRITDLKPQTKVIGDVNNCYLGIVKNDYQPKPAEKAIAFANKFYSQKLRCIDNTVKVEKKMNSDAQVHVYENEDGSAMVVGWLQTDVPSERGSDTTGDVKDTREETVQVTIPLKLSSNVIEYNELGQEMMFSGNINNSPQNTVIKNVTLKGGKIFIAKINK